MKNKTVQKILFTMGSLAVGAATKSLVSFIWTRVRGNEPPSNPAHSDVKMSEALGWTLSLALVASLAKTFYRKKVTEKLALDV